MLLSTRSVLESVDARLDTHRELRRLRGENFNVFRLLHMERSEDELHSRFIAELLDPRGMHDLGTTFLQLFLDRVGKEVGRRDWIHAEHATVKREEVIGPVEIDGEHSTGGRIDIFISDRERHLSIENKIGAVEGEKQVTRYCNYRPDRHFVLFLTVHGDEADTEKDNYRSISYSEHILPWLESCQRHAADLPILRETIKQYIITVKGLTGGRTMDSQIRDAMKRHYRAAWEIRQTFGDLLFEEVQDLAQQVRNLIEAQAEQQGWAARAPQKRPGLVLSQQKSEKSWGGTEVVWEDDWLGIRVASESPVAQQWAQSRADVHKEFPWLDHGKEGEKEPFYGYLPKRFNSPEGLEHLFNESKRSELAHDIAEKLQALAVYCDRRLAPGNLE